MRPACHYAGLKCSSKFVFFFFKSFFWYQKSPIVFFGMWCFGHQIGWLNCFALNCRGLWILIWPLSCYLQLLKLVWWWYEVERLRSQGKIQRWRLWRSPHKSGPESWAAQLDVFLFFVVLIANRSLLTYTCLRRKCQTSLRMDFMRMKT